MSMDIDYKDIPEHVRKAAKDGWSSSPNGFRLAGAVAAGIAAVMDDDPVEVGYARHPFGPIQCVRPSEVAKRSLERINRGI